MGRFQLELFIFITYFSIVIPISSCDFFPVRLVINDKRPIGKKTQLVIGTMVEK
jgi:hypothetical protein